MVKTMVGSIRECTELFSNWILVRPRPDPLIARRQGFAAITLPRDTVDSGGANVGRAFSLLADENGGTLQNSWSHENIKPFMERRISGCCWGCWGSISWLLGFPSRRFPPAYFSHFVSPQLSCRHFISENATDPRSSSPTLLSFVRSILDVLFCIYTRQRVGGGVSFCSRSTAPAMYYWKEKVADKLSRLLADSPASSPHFGRESPTLRPDTQAIPFPTTSYSDPCTPTVSSVFLSFLPNGSARSNGQKGSNSTEQCKDSSSWFRSASSKSWKFEQLPAEENSVDNSPTSARECVFNGMLGACERVHNDLQRSTNICDDIHTNEISTSENISRNLPNLMDQSSFISAELYEFLSSSIPNIVRGCQWVLLYSASKHGISLCTLLRNSDDLPGPCLLVDCWGYARCSVWWVIKCSFETNNEKEVSVYGGPRLFRATGANRYYFMCLNDLLALGGGGSYALCLDGDLLHGTSGPSETFGNECLAHNEEFEPKNVELWGFSHCSRYLS